MGSTTIQLILHVYLSGVDFKDGCYIESFFKLALGIMRGYQVRKMQTMLQQRNAFLKDPAFKNLFLRIGKRQQAYQLLRQQFMGNLLEITQGNRQQTAAYKGSLFSAAESSKIIDSDKNFIGAKLSPVMGYQLADNLVEGVRNQDVQIEGLDDVVYSAGARFHGYGKSLVKGMNIVFKNVEEDGQAFVKLEFGISPVHRARLEKTIEQIKNISATDMKEFLSLTDSQAQDIDIRTDDPIEMLKQQYYKYFSQFNLREEEILKTVDVHIDKIFSNKTWFHSFLLDIQLMHYISIENLGLITIGSNPNHLGSYNQVVVKVEKDKNLFDIFEVLSLLGLEDALLDSAEQDVQRLKISYLYHTFFSKESYKLEREDIFVDLPVDQLKAEMIKRAPEAELFFQRYLDKMQLKDLLPGMSRYAIAGLEKEAYRAGARFLAVNVITKTDDNDGTEIIRRTASILKTGLFSVKLKDNMGMLFKGLTGDHHLADAVGSLDGVFTQLITENVCKEQMNVSELEYSWFDGRIIFIIDLKALEMGTYQYHTGNFGDKRNYDPDSDFFDEYCSGGSENYPFRENVLEFIQKENQKFSEENEVISGGRILPQWIKGVIVRSEKLKQDLIAFLINQKIIINGQILRQNINHFIHVTDHFSEDLVPAVQI